MNARHILLASAVLVASHAALAQETPKPLKLYGGVQQNDIVSPSPQQQTQQVQQAADDARRKAEAQRWRDVSTFLDNPRVYRVTKVDPVEKGQGGQHIMALPIRSVKINQNGKVDLGEIVEGSGDSMEVPPGTCKVGDLITVEQGQFVEVPKDHFDPLGGLCDAGKQQTPMSPTTILLNAANQMDRVATQAENNAMTAANHFTAGLAKWAKNTLDFMSQERGDFGRPGKPAQAILDYLNNDHNENDQKLYEGAVAALDQLQNDPAAFWGEQGPNLIPLGELGKEAETGRMMQAAKRLSKMQNTADEFGTFENAAARAAQADRAAAQKTEQSAQRAQQAKADPRQQQPPPRQQPPRDSSPRQRQQELQRAQADARQQQPQRAQTDARQQPQQREPSGQQSQQRQQEQQRAQSDARQQQQQPQPGQQRPSDAKPQPRDQLADQRQQQQQRSPSDPQQQPQQSAPSRQQPKQPPDNTPSPTSDPMKGDTAPMSPTPDPMKGDTAPLSPAQDAVPAPQNPPASDVGQPAAPDNNPQPSPQPDQWKPVVNGKIVPSPPSPTARGLPELNPLVNIDPDLKNCFQTALAQDATWASGKKTIALPLEATSPPGTTITGTARQDVMSTLKNKYGAAPKDPLHGDVGLLAHRQGIPVPSSQSDITRALNTAKADSRGIVFIERSDGTAHAFNARYNNGQVEFLDPQFDKPADFSNVTKTWFYRTN